jgi:hypothetical protein
MWELRVEPAFRHRGVATWLVRWTGSTPDSAGARSVVLDAAGDASQGRRRTIPARENAGMLGNVAVILRVHSVGPARWMAGALNEEVSSRC